MYGAGNTRRRRKTSTCILRFTYTRAECAFRGMVHFITVYDVLFFFVFSRRVHRPRCGEAAAAQIHVLQHAAGAAAAAAPRLALARRGEPPR